jgi:YVTN family beta-propeller protein
MNFRISGLLAIVVFVVACLLGSAESLAQNAYITNFESNFVSVIDTTTDAVIAGIPVGTDPNSLAGTPDGSTVYVANKLTNNVSRIATATNTVTATIRVGFAPVGIAVIPDGSTVYVANFQSNNVSVISTATNTVTDTIAVGIEPRGVAVTPDGSTVYVANSLSNTVSVIAAATEYGDRDDSQQFSRWRRGDPRRQQGLYHGRGWPLGDRYWHHC